MEANMFSIERIATTLFCGVLFFAAAGTGAADAQQQPLPDVTVTAPAVQDPYAVGDPHAPRTVAPTQINPYYGRNRVDESMFAERPCSETRFSSNVPGGKCLEGYKIESKVQSSSAGPCHIQLDVVMGSTATYSFEADVFVFDPYLVGSGGQGLPKGCSVGKQSDYDLARLQDMNQMTRRGTNWRNYSDTAGIQSEYSDGRLNCLAFRRLGPNWQGGVIWSVHASICRLDGAAVQPADVHAMLSSLKIRVYDAVANIRPPEQSIMYVTIE
jgi:hypothetical protein